MVGALAHRGPDSQGTWFQGPVALGHTRLAILDLSSMGNQPMVSADQRFAVVLNGEIYNHRDLRHQLETAGQAFVSQCDTEVLLHGFRQWGVGLFPKLRGMFAAALWDRDERRLTLLRDPVGKKPLVYAHHRDVLLFASEIQAILAVPDFPRHPDSLAIHHYLSLQYVPNPRSAFDGVHRLPPGHYLEVVDQSPPRVVAYAALPHPRRAGRRDRREAVAELDRLLEQAVRRRLQADVPVGAFLSGGLDSSAVVAMMTRLATGPVKTFTIGFEEAAFDERPQAQAVAERFGTEHHHLLVRPDVEALLPRLARHYGDPFADSSAIPTWYLAEMTRAHVTVALNGDGGDEALLGYPRYGRCRPAGWLDHVPHWGRKLLSPWLALDSRRYERDIAYVHDRAKPMLYGPALAECLGRSSLDLLEPYFAAAPDMTMGAAWADLHTYLPDDLLVKVDIATMAHGLEARSPFLDQDFLHWACGIAAADRMPGGDLKHLLKQWLRPQLPDSLIDRPKMGFGIPLDQWLRGPLRPLAEDLLLSEQSRRRQWFNPDGVAFLWNRHLSGQSNLQAPLWALMMLEQWQRVWLDRPPARHE